MSLSNNIPWKPIYFQESFCTDGNIIGVQINYKFPLKLTKEDEIKFKHIAYELYDYLNKKYQMSLINLPKQREDILSCFPSQFIFVEEIPNEYDGMAPWFLVTTTKGRVKIGWRKRVINIDWSQTINTKTAEELFPDEDVTKSREYDENPKFIHAWGYIKAKEYLRKILEQ